MVFSVTCDITYTQSFHEIDLCPSGSPLLTVTTDRKLQCAKLCHNLADCLSFRFVSGTCYLFNQLSMISNANIVQHKHGQCYAKADIVLCETQSGTLTCSSNKKIHINWAMYGEDQGASHCSKTNDKTVRCYSQNAMATVQTLCESKSTCELKASNTVFGDPCGGVHKYLHVKYMCRAPDKDL
ncbi:hypothetical protein DPMN_189848 [Dreissena polymorpha]|uniref:SUEL-type lectin domain-containing protein n=1 Tax=Dreissena polymorpha TaxID=45954 RepID=A0A9D4DUT7_DREPO|nr:hypothetical protein DPMN_189848 [Dreissena polymorpha]